MDHLEANILEMMPRKTGEKKTVLKYAFMQMFANILAHNDNSI